MKPPMLSMVLSLIVLIPATARVEEPVPVPRAEEIAALVQQLGDASFKTRDAAQSKLLEIGTTIRPLLLELPASDNPEIRRRVELILKVLFQRELARVHVIGVGIYQTHFGRVMARNEVYDAARELIAAEQDKSASPRKRILELLDPLVKKSLEDPAIREMLQNQADPASATSAPARRLLIDLQRAFVKLGDAPNLYEEKSFAEVKLSPEAKALLPRRDKLAPLESRWLNHELISAVFPRLLRSDPDNPANGIVTIRIPESKQPLVLVLSAYESAIWQIQADPKSNLLQVIVGGYNPQYVSGVKAPIEHRVCMNLPGFQRNRDCFYCYMSSGANYTKMQNTVTQIVGKGIGQFHGAYNYDGKPIIIDPNQ